MNTEKIVSKIKNKPQKTVDLYLESINELISLDNYGDQSRISLNKKIDEYLLAAAKEITINYSIKIIIHSKDNNEINISMISNLIHDYYKKQKLILLQERKKKSKQWRIRLLFGIFFLAVCHGISLLFSLSGSTAFSNLMQDSFEIMGWVAIWEPALYFLFTRKEEAYELSDYIQLENADISLN